MNVLHRDILFRGKSLSEKSWTYGDLLRVRRDVVSIVTKDYNELASWHVEPETVGQYSGLKDKNEEMMFEGDIVSGLFVFGMSVKGVVGFEGGSFGVRWSRGDAIHFTPFTSTCNITWEVIGNVHDNPEVME